MRVDARVVGKVVVVTVDAPRIDAGLVHAFLHAATVATRGNQGTVVLDMSHVQFIDSSGLGALVALRKALGTEATMALAAQQPRVTTLFRLTRMDKVFVSFATVADAVSGMERA